MLHVSYTHKLNIYAIFVHTSHMKFTSLTIQMLHKPGWIFKIKQKKNAEKKLKSLIENTHEIGENINFCKKNLKIEKNVENSGQMKECFICFLFEHCTFELNAIWFSGVQFLNRGKIQIIRFKCFFGRFH